MSDIAIKVENLGKSYKIGHKSVKNDRYTALRDVIANNAKNIVRKTRDMMHGRAIVQGDEVEEFWALKDINFEIKQGERVGILGRNGAGKSTLLKILSRITEPTTGRIRINGRVASLLEVGTGFHPELTGRENIFLNGAILGMSRQEILRKFDEIVDFAEVEKFLDTPVKRYSSGMYVRLAFAVAAHLEPEILIVDEVLAVGDVQFQKKCLGKMEEVGAEGRTVIFVSHNMGTIRNLCSRAVMLSNGKFLLDGDVSSVVDTYLSYGREENTSEVIWDKGKGPSCEEIELRSIRALDLEGRPLAFFNATKPIDIEIGYTIKKPLRGMRIVMTLLTNQGEIAFSSTNHAVISDMECLPGSYQVTCRIPGDLLNAITYSLRIHIGQPGVKVLIPAKEYLNINVEGVGGHGSNFTETWPGVLAPKIEWH
jgi:lipopolysaccharide transport system ATP-binding protein